MATVNDIPSREGNDGTKQLALLRAYLKDSEVGKHKYPDTLLVPLLVAKDAVQSWRDLTGSGAKSVPWSYDPIKLTLPVNRIRAVTGDTIELTLKYTDYELLKLLEVIPLRYIVSLIKAKEANGKTFPSDTNDPIHILRKYLEDEAGKKYTDAQLADMVFTSGLDPFAVVVEIMKKAIGASSASTVVKTGTNLASLDGISFSNPMSETRQSQYNKDVVLQHSFQSVYVRDPVYGAFMDGKNIAVTDWETEWYAL